MNGGGAPQRNLYNETFGELSAKAQAAPFVWQSESAYDPLYSDLANTELSDTLFGTAGGKWDLPDVTSIPGYTAPGNISRVGRMAPPSMEMPRPALGGPGNRRGGRGISGMVDHRGRDPHRFIPPANPYPRTVDRQATPGILSLMQRAGTSQRASNISDWSNLSPSAMEAIRKSNPQLAQGIDSMMATTGAQYRMGGQMDPAQMRTIQQTIRSRQGGMLGGTGNAGDYGEALGISQFGQGLAQQRMQNYMGALGFDQGYYTPQLSDMMNRPYDPAQVIGQGAGISGAAGPRMFGSSINANDVYSSNQNASAANRAANTAATSSLAGAGISGLAGLGSSAILASMFV